jgi:hypothetical protein
MADNEQKAEQLVAEAEKKLNAKPFLGTWLKFYGCFLNYSFFRCFVALFSLFVSLSADFLVFKAILICYFSDFMICFALFLICILIFIYVHGCLSKELQSY